jgi:dTDP-4-amino-4,6-dideoxygalactose transaminase
MNKKPIPILDLKAQYASIKVEINTAIERVLESQQFILGPEVEALEKELADYCQCSHAFGVSSGTDALLLSLMAIGIQSGDEIITSPYSFFASSGSIARLGAKPVFVDIDPATFNIQAEGIASKITSRTKAILPVHLAGQVAEMDPILELARKNGLFVIEDACQAIGSDYKGHRAGSMGILGCFSFFPSKNLGGYGDSGLITCKDAGVAEKVALLRNHGQRPKYQNLMLGGNFRMDALQAAVLRAKFNHLEQWTETRRKHAENYRNLFCERGISVSLSELGNKKGIVLPTEMGTGRHIYHLYIVRSNYRDALAQYLHEYGISSEIYYPVPLHLQDCFRSLGYQAGDFPESEKASRQTLALPIYPELTEEMQTRVADTIADFIKAQP